MTDTTQLLIVIEGYTTQWTLEKWQFNVDWLYSLPIRLYGFEAVICRYVYRTERSFEAGWSSVFESGAVQNVSNLLNCRVIDFCNQDAKNMACRPLSFIYRQDIAWVVLNIAYGCDGRVLYQFKVESLHMCGVWLTRHWTTGHLCTCYVQLEEIRKRGSSDLRGV